MPWAETGPECSNLVPSEYIETKTGAFVFGFLYQNKNVLYRLGCFYIEQKVFVSEISISKQ